jgi:hypothetical protein
LPYTLERNVVLGKGFFDFARFRFAFLARRRAVVTAAAA